jgi:hypothetical protein
VEALARLSMHYPTLLHSPHLPSRHYCGKFELKVISEIESDVVENNEGAQKGSIYR